MAHVVTFCMGMPLFLTCVGTIFVKLYGKIEGD